MSDIFFKNIPEQYKSYIDTIQNTVIKKIYSKFSFLILEKQSNNDKTEPYLLNYLKNYKFATYYLTKANNHNEHVQSKKSDQNSCFENQETDAIIAIEDKCLIIEQINPFLINNIITTLQTQQIIILNTRMTTNSNKESIEEIDNFCSSFDQEIRNNYFVKKTIRPLIGYLIRRYFYPTDYFSDSSFFNFKQINKSKEKDLKEKLYQILEIDGEKDPIEPKLTKAINDFKEYDNDNRKIEEFENKEFIVLRIIHVNVEYYFSLVIHLESFYIFMMKKTLYKRAIKNKHEIFFCQNYSHRCLMPFYGFLKEEDKIIGFIYEFMSNDSLQSYYDSHTNERNKIIELMMTNRIFQGIEYLHKNNLIYQDLKPLNVLLDHDYVPYISDFETIRQINNNKGNESESTLTKDISSTLYISPEQYAGHLISYETDIYSFGLIIYYLFEHKNKFDQNRFNYCIEKNNMVEGTMNIRNLHELCISKIPSKRPNMKRIKQVIIDELNDFNIFEQFFFDKSSKVEYSRIVHCIFESIIIQLDDIKNCISFICCIQSIICAKYDNDYPLVLVKLGNRYYKGLCVIKDYVKAKEYYELSAELNNSHAITNLGILYYFGYGVQKDYHKAKEYFELAAKQNHNTAHLFLGSIYYNGLGVPKDYYKAKEYFELAAKSNDVTSLMNLGSLYFNGYGVQKDIYKAREYLEQSYEIANSNDYFYLGTIYELGYLVRQSYIKARKYYELAADENNSIALHKLGLFYYNGLGVDMNYLMAKKYFELDAKQNNSESILMLGIMHFYGFGVTKDYMKSIKYFEMSAKLNNSTAMLNLGIIYSYGYGVAKDYLRAREYYEFSAQFNNSKAIVKLGDLYLNSNWEGYNILKSKKYYELAANLKNPKAYFNLGKLYLLYDPIIKKDFLKAKSYFELSAELNYSDAFIILGLIYLNGNEVEIDYSKAIHYFESAAQLNNHEAFFYLGYLYSNNDIFDIDISKATKYLTECIQNSDSLNKTFLQRANNDLGLIYLTVFKNIEKATELIKEAAFAEYPFAQNNFGLINLLYLNNIVNADYLFEKCSKHHFALAEYNLGYLKEKERKIKESIKYYIKASNDENVKIVYLGRRQYDKRLKVSKTFVICFTNLKITEYYLVKNKYQKAKEYFTRSFSKLLSNNNYQFLFKYKSNCKNKKTLFSYLKMFIINHPLFNLKNQPNLKSEINELEDKTFEFSDDLCDMKDNNKSYSEEIKEKKNSFKKNHSFGKNLILKDPIQFFEYAIQNQKMANIFITEIRSIIELMQKIIYTPPYDILFGRIHLRKQIANAKSIPKNINDFFYEGLGIDVYNSE